MVYFDLSPFEGGVSKGKGLLMLTFHLSREESRKVKGGLFLPFHLPREESRKVKGGLFLPFTFRGRSLGT